MKESRDAPNESSEEERLSEQNSALENTCLPPPTDIANGDPAGHNPKKRSSATLKYQRRYMVQ